LNDLPTLGGKKAATVLTNDFEQLDLEAEKKKGKNKKPAAKSKGALSAAEKHLDEFYQEQKDGYKITSQANSKFKVNVYGIPHA